MAPGTIALSVTPSCSALFADACEWDHPLGRNPFATSLDASLLFENRRHLIRPDEGFPRDVATRRPQTSTSLS